MIGQGGFGKVYAGKYRGAAVAIKEMDDVTSEELVAEAKFLSRLKNHNIVKFVAISHDLTSIMMEYVCYCIGVTGRKIHSLEEFLKVFCRISL